MNQNIPSLHPCNLTDLPTLQAISRETFAATFGAANTTQDLAKYLDTAYATDKLHREMINPDSHFYFVQVGSEVCGYLKVNTGDAQSEAMGANDFEVERIYVRPAYQKRGYGRILIELAEALATNAHKDQMWLGVWEHNDNARGFYAQIGFHRIGQHTFTLGSSQQTDYLMAKPL
ncbi:GNAT family N-acetyltransferase [Levilactobacillus namurensis]|uniref:GNAT family N-acetyltransferase n=1 Tax=Levilactobacillus namurensis TaxID=380393 RepID=UPI001D51EECA|nr:GNAT family N-acetyltransferase [Levilactobacillus namurensis]HJE45533.1 GNAT family N-acetyltransferase [Levilactobacillus namurensis]